MKNDRQRKILQIIKEHEIGTQEALIDKLAQYGVEATQTTISRDIRQLNLVKGPTGHGTYKYIVASAREESGVPGHNSALNESVVSIDIAQNIVVVKTHSGMANALAVCIEGMNIHQIVGSVAGDDTILVVARSAENAETIANKLRSAFAY